MSVNKRDFALFNQISDAAAKQIAESRNFYEKMFKNTASALLLIATVVIGVFYWLIGQKYSEIEATVIKRTDDQIVQLRQQIRDRLEEEFKTDKMRELIRAVAQQQTKTGLSDVIAQTVSEQVRSAIKAQTPSIQQTVAVETKKAVSGLSPIIETAVKEEASEAEARIRNRLAQWEELLQAGNLAILARNGSGDAYDRLLAMATKKRNQEIEMIAITTTNQLFLELNQPFYVERGFVEKKSEQELLKLLDAPQPLVRKAAIDALVKQKNKSIIPKLLEKAERDPFIVVRGAAYRGLKVLTGEKIEALQIDRWKAWWAKNKDSWQQNNK